MQDIPPRRHTQSSIYLEQGGINSRSTRKRYNINYELPKWANHERAPNQRSGMLLNMWMNVPCIRQVKICAGQSQIERAHAIDSFNNEASIQVCLASSKAASTSINMQKDCCMVICVDIVNPNTGLQIVGRVFRIGQKRRQHIWFLTTEATYDQVLQAKNAQKMIAQIGATAKIEVTEQDREHAFVIAARSKAPLYYHAD